MKTNCHSQSDLELAGTDDRAHGLTRGMNVSSLSFREGSSGGTTFALLAIAVVTTLLRRLA